MAAWTTGSSGRRTAWRRRAPAHSIAEVVAATPLTVETLRLAIKQERRVSEQPVVVEIGQVDPLGVEGLYDVRFLPARVHLRDGKTAHLDETFVDGPAKESGDNVRRVDKPAHFAGVVINVRDHYADLALHSAF